MRIWSHILFLALLSSGCLATPKSEFIALPGGVSINMEEKMVSFPLQVINLTGGLEFILTKGRAKQGLAM